MKATSKKYTRYVPAAFALMEVVFLVGVCQPSSTENAGGGRFPDRVVVHVHSKVSLPAVKRTPATEDF